MVTQSSTALPASEPHSRHMRKLAGGSGYAMLGLLGGAALQYGYNFGLARLFGANATGTFIFAFSLVNIAAILGQLGAQELALRYVAAYRQVGDDAYLRGVLTLASGLGLAGSALLGLFLWMGAEAIAAAAGKPEVSELIRGLVWLVPLTALALLLAAAFQGAQRLDRSILLRELGRPLAVVLALVGVWIWGQGTGRFVFWNVFFLLAFVVGGAALAWREFADAWHTTARYQFAVWIPFTLSVMLMDLFRSTVGWLDTLILGFFVPADQVAIYFAALRTALLVTILLGATNAVLAPMAAGLWHGGELAQLDRVYKTTTRWTCTLVLPVALITLLLRHELMAIFGDAYTAAGGVLLIVLAGRTVNGLTGGVGRLLVMTGHQRVELVNTVVTAVAMVGGMVWAARVAGVYGVAVVNSAVIIIMNVVKLVQVKRLVGIQPYEWRYAKVVLATGAAFVAGMFVKDHMHTQPLSITIVLTTLAVAVAYGGALLVQGMETEDRKLWSLSHLSNRVS